MTEPLTLHPGEILRDDFLEPYGVTQYRLAKVIGIHETRVSDIVLGKRAITADTALRLGRFFGTGAEFWMNLQAHYDLRIVEGEIRRDLERIPSVEDVAPLAGGEMAARGFAASAGDRGADLVAHCPHGAIVGQVKAYTNADLRIFVSRAMQVGVENCTKPDVIERLATELGRAPGAVEVVLRWVQCMKTGERPSETADVPSPVKNRIVGQLSEVMLELGWE